MSIVEIKEGIESQMQMSGLSDGLYGDYASEVAKAYADSQEVKERHWGELLDVLAKFLNDPADPHSATYALDVDIDGSWDVYAKYGKGGSGETYAELYKRLGLAGDE